MLNEIAQTHLEGITSSNQPVGVIYAVARFTPLLRRNQVYHLRNHTITIGYESGDVLNSSLT
jgi:hypothetical protein